MFVVALSVLVLTQPIITFIVVDRDASAKREKIGPRL